METLSHSKNTVQRTNVEEYKSFLMCDKIQNWVTR